MNDVLDLFERVADQAAAQARPAPLAALQRRRARRTEARAGVGAALAGAALAMATAPWSPARAPDVVVADAVPSPPSTGEPSAPAVPAGKVAVQPAQRSALGLAPADPPVADLLSSHPTDRGLLITAGLRRCDELCATAFTAGPADLPSADAGCTPTTLPAYASDRIELTAASAGATGAEVSWLVLRGSAPPGTRTVVVRAAGGAQERLAVSGAGPEYLDRAWFALPWVEQDTEVEALDAEGRTLAREELLLGMGQPPG